MQFLQSVNGRLLSTSIVLSKLKDRDTNLTSQDDIQKILKFLKETNTCSKEEEEFNPFDVGMYVRSR